MPSYLVYVSKLSVYVHQANGHADFEMQITDADVICALLCMTSEVVDDFAASLYPPCDKTEVKGYTSPLTNHLTCLLDTFR